MLIVGGGEIRLESSSFLGDERESDAVLQAIIDNR